MNLLVIGGGSAMDAGKIMWVMYEHPEADFMDMAMRFMDIRKRIYTFPKMGEKAYFIAVPTSSGTYPSRRASASKICNLSSPFLAALKREINSSV